MTYKSEGWVWSNQTTTGCANCYYCWNGCCSYGGRCIGTEMRIVNGAWQTVPIGSPVGKEKDQWGDIVKLKKITLLHGHLYQIDYYNETRGYHGRMFIEKKQIENAEIADDTILDKNCMIDLFRCPTCASNVFTKIKKWNGDIVYRCHGCDTEYAGE